MTWNHEARRRPGLLVSVRNAAEALAALAGGADLIDVKEPSRGALGAADPSEIAAVVRAVAGRAPVSAALGELNDVLGDRERRAGWTIPGGVSVFKIGLAGCRDNFKWPELWRAAIGRAVEPGPQPAARPVAVVYADWQAVAAPEPAQVLTLAVETQCPALLVDTFDKSSGSLFDHWRAAELAAFVRHVQSHGIAAVLAGSLTADTISTAVSLGPDLVAVRTAACEQGRNGVVATWRVKTLHEAIRAAANVSCPARKPGRVGPLSFWAGPQGATGSASALRS